MSKAGPDVVTDIVIIFAAAASLHDVSLPVVPLLDYFWLLPVEHASSPVVGRFLGAELSGSGLIPPDGLASTVNTREPNYPVSVLFHVLTGLP